MALTEAQVQKLNTQFKGIPPEEIISWAGSLVRYGL